MTLQPAIANQPAAHGEDRRRMGMVPAIANAGKQVDPGTGSGRT